MPSKGYTVVKRIKRPNGKTDYYFYSQRSVRVGNRVHTVEARCLGRASETDYIIHAEKRENKCSSTELLLVGRSGSGAANNGHNLDGEFENPNHGEPWTESREPVFGNPFVKIEPGLEQAQNQSADVPLQKSRKLNLDGCRLSDMDDVCSDYQMSKIGLQRQWLRANRLAENMTGQSLSAVALQQGGSLHVKQYEEGLVLRVPKWGTSCSRTSVQKAYRQMLGKAVLDQIEKERPAAYRMMAVKLDHGRLNQKCALLKYAMQNHGSASKASVALRTIWLGRLPKKEARAVFGTKLEASWSSWRSETEVMLGNIISAGPERAYGDVDRQIAKFNKRVESNIKANEDRSRWYRDDGWKSVTHKIGKGKKAKKITRRIFKEGPYCKRRRQIKKDLAAINLLKMQRKRIEQLSHITSTNRCRTTLTTK